MDTQMATPTKWDNYLRFVINIWVVKLNLVLATTNRTGIGRNFSPNFKHIAISAGDVAPLLFGREVFVLGSLCPLVGIMTETTI